MSANTSDGDPIATLRDAHTDTTDRDMAVRLQRAEEALALIACVLVPFTPASVEDMEPLEAVAEFSAVISKMASQALRRSPAEVSQIARAAVARVTAEVAAEEARGDR